MAELSPGTLAITTMFAEVWPAFRGDYSPPVPQVEVGTLCCVIGGSRVFYGDGHHYVFVLTEQGYVGELRADWLEEA